MIYEYLILIILPKQINGHTTTLSSLFGCTRQNLDFSHGGLDFSQVGLDFSQGGLDFKQGGLDFRQGGLDFS